MRCLLAVCLLCLASCKKDIEKLCAFDPSGGPEVYAKLESSLGSKGKDTLQALGMVSPLDKGSILRGMAEDEGLKGCPAADAMDRMAGIDAATGCTSRSKTCTLDGLDAAKVKALQALPDKVGRGLMLTFSSQGELDLLGKLDWLEELHLVADRRASHLGAVDLKPVGSIKGLKVLSLREVTVLSLAPLSALEELTSLRAEHLGCAGPLDLGFVAGLTKLETLDLSAEGLASHLGPLAGAGALRTLKLLGLSVPDLAPLGKLTGLTELQLPRRVAGETPTPSFGPRARVVHYETTGGNLEPIAGLVNLVTLDAGGQGLTDISPLAGLSKLESLSLEWNDKLANIAPLSRLTELKSLDLSHTSVADLKPLNAPNLQSLRLRDTRVNALKPIFGLRALGSIRLPDDFPEAARRDAQANWPGISLD